MSCLDWNQPLVASGGRDGDIVLHDVRVAAHQVSRLAGHQQEVCGLAWAGDGKTLASGGNDNTVPSESFTTGNTALSSMMCKKCFNF